VISPGGSNASALDVPDIAGPPVHAHGRRSPVILTGATGPGVRWRSPRRFDGATEPLDEPWLEEIGRVVRGMAGG
jgi:hypothetical protein